MSFTNHFSNSELGLPEYPSSSGRLLSHKALIEEYLAGLTFSENPQFTNLIEVMRCSLLAGGDRLRSVLCMEVAGGFGLDPVRVLPSAAAIEFVHTLSLIHDELPALVNGESRERPIDYHEEFGEATAILAGDGFFGESLALITASQQGTPEQVLTVLRELATSTGVSGMVGGQVLHVRCEGSSTQDLETHEIAHAYRTGALIEASARIGAILAGATEREKRVISEYARQLSLCIRLADEAPERANKLCDSALEVLETVRADTSGLEELIRCARDGEYRQLLGECE